MHSKTDKYVLNLSQKLVIEKIKKEANLSLLFLNQLICLVMFIY